MLYVAQIDVPNRAVWGNTHSLELLLPSKVRNIHGYLVNAVLASNTRLKRCSANRFMMADGQIVPTVTYIVRQDDGSVITTNEAPNGDPADPSVIASYQTPSTFKTLGDQPISSQIGVVSLSLNNTQIIADSTPLCVTQHLTKQGVVPNTITLPKDEIVQGGSFLRVIIEEQQLSPFLTKEEWEAISDAHKESYYGTGNTEIVPTNAYTAKIYLNYD